MATVQLIRQWLCFCSPLAPSEINNPQSAVIWGETAHADENVTIWTFFWLVMIRRPHARPCCSSEPGCVEGVWQLGCDRDECQEHPGKRARRSSERLAAVWSDSRQRFKMLADCLWYSFGGNCVSSPTNDSSGMCVSVYVNEIELKMFTHTVTNLISLILSCTAGSPSCLIP